MNNLMKLLIILFIVIILTIILFWLDKDTEHFIPSNINNKLISDTNSPCLLENETILPPIPVPAHIPLSSSNSDECLDQMSLENFSPCFNDSIQVGNPLKDQCQADTNPGSIQVVNGSNQTRWFFWSSTENESSLFQKSWVNRLSSQQIPYSTWSKEELTFMGIFQLEAKQCILLPFLGIGVKLMPVTDCPDNLTLDNLIDGEQFFNKCWISSCGLEMPQTILEWSYTPNEMDQINISVVEGWSRPCRIEYIDNSQQIKSIKMGNFSKPGCIDCKGKSFPTREGLNSSCSLPCSDKNIKSETLNEKDYCSTTTCYPNTNVQDSNCSPKWCAGLRKFFSLNTENLGYCYGYKQNSKSINDYKKNNSRIKVIFC